MPDGRVIWLNPVPNIRFEGGPAPCTIIGTSRFQNQLTLYLRVPILDAYGEGYVVYLVHVDSAYRDLPWQQT